MLSFIVVLICIGISGLLSAAEIAFVTARRRQLDPHARESEIKRALLHRLRENPERTLSVIQLGESFVNAVAAAVGFIGTAEFLTPLMTKYLMVSEGAAQIVAVIVVTLGFTYLDVVFGELVPKIFALKHPAWVARIASGPLAALDKILRPAVLFLDWSTRVVVKKLLRIKNTKQEEVGLEFDFDRLSDTHRACVLNLASFQTRSLRELYIPWEKIDVVEWHQNQSEVLEHFARTGHTRLPVVKDAEVIGMINSREFLAAVVAKKSDWHAFVRMLPRLQISSKFLRALRILQNSKNHMALVCEGAEVLGIVTVEIILEQIVGRILNEDDDGALGRILGPRPISESLAFLKAS